jgi:hypothetical protein
LTSDLDFETNLHNLGGRNPKIRGRKIGVEVHRGEQGFSASSLFGVGSDSQSRG